MAKCKICGVHIEEEDGCDIGPDYCDECLDMEYELHFQYDEFSDADPGL